MIPNIPQALGNNLVVEVIHLTKSPTGIITPETYEPDPILFRVLSVGPGRLLKNGQRVPLDIKPGDRVLSRYNTAKHFEWQGRPLRVLSASEVQAVCSDDPRVQ